jgi:hypothetical protein
MTKTFTAAMVALVLAPAGNAADKTDPNLPSAQGYFAMAALVQACKAVKPVAAPALPALKQQVIAYYQRKMKLAQGAEAAKYAAGLRQLEAGTLPKAELDLYRTAFAKQDPAMARMICGNAPQVVETTLASGDLSMAMESGNKQEIDRASRASIEQIQKNSGTIQGNLEEMDRARQGAPANPKPRE